MEWLTLAGFAVAALAAGSTGAAFPPGEWYQMLRKPTWTPPNWVFPVAWTVLYAAMVYAAWRVAMHAPPALAAPALAVWAAQIVLNALWTPVFFGLRKLGAALFVVAALWIAVVTLLLLFLRADLIAGALIAPYLVWVSYATALNAKIWRDNPRSLRA